MRFARDHHICSAILIPRITRWSSAESMGTFHGVKTYNQISVGLLEMSSVLQSMKTARKTRRSSRQVVLDELELVMRRLEQIKNMVDKHCVAPAKQIVVPLQSKAQAQQQQQQAQAEIKATVAPLTPVQEEAEDALEAAPEEAEAAPEEAEAEVAVEPSKLALAAEPAMPRRRKSGGCPGGPKAYNEFVKKWLAEQRAAGKEMTYQEALKVIKQNNIYTQSCGLPPKKNKTRKLNKGNKGNQTPGRVNAPYVPYAQHSPNASGLSPSSLSSSSLAASAAPSSLSSAAAPAAAPQVKERGKSLPPTAANLEKQESERKYLEEGIASRTAARQAEAGLPPMNEATSPALDVSSSVPTESGYEDLGMNDNLGMRKIRVNGRQLLMTNGNSGLFEDNDGAPGEFIGYLKNGKVTASSPPEL